jgi:hypothetical protein
LQSFLRGNVLWWPEKISDWNPTTDLLTQPKHRWPTNPREQENPLIMGGKNFYRRIRGAYASRGIKAAYEIEYHAEGAGQNITGMYPHHLLDKNRTKPTIKA